MAHPAYWHDLPPLDFFLNGWIKEQLGGQKFRSENAVVDVVQKATKNVKKFEFRKCFDDWFVSMQKCIDAEGD